MPDTETVEQTESAPAPAQPAAQPRRGRAIAGVAVVALIGFIAIAHAVGVIIPLLVLAGLAVLFALAGLVRGLRHVSGLKGNRLRLGRSRRSVLRRPGGGRPQHLAPFPGARRTSGPTGRKRGATGNRTRGKGLPGRMSRAIHSGRRGKQSGTLNTGRRKSRAGQPGTGLGTRRRGGVGLGRMHPPQRRGLFRPGGRTPGQGTRRAARRTLGQRLHIPGANRRAARRQQRGAGPAGRPGSLPRGLFGRIRARRAARRPAGSQPQPRTRGRRVAAGLGAALALPFVLPFTARRAYKRRKLRKAAQAPHGRPSPQQAKPSRWKRLRDRLRRKPQPQPAPPPQPAPEPPKPAPEPEAVPGRARQRPHEVKNRITKGRTRNIMTAAIDAATEAIDTNIGGWQPENAIDLDHFLQDLPQLFDSMSTAFNTVADTLGDQFPVDPSVPEKLREIGAAIGSLDDTASEAHSVHRSAHEAELRRIEEPRPNEQMWDTTENN
jgi:hypothetical protein